MAGFDGLPDLDAPDVFDIRVVTPEALEAGAAQADADQTEEERPVVNTRLDYVHPYLQDIPAKLTATGVGQSYKAAEAAEDTPPPRPEVTLRQPRFAQEKRGLTPAERGTAHHLFMQFCDFDTCAMPGGAAQELERLRDKHILSPEQADAVDVRQIEAFFASDLYRQAFSAARVRREFKFSVVAPAASYYPVAEDAPEETVLLQGVIDCLLETDTGFVVVDFKTDRVRAQDAADRAEKYRPQLDAYGHAVQAIFGKPVTGRVLYFLTAGQEVWL